MVKAISSDRADEIGQLTDEELMNKYREDGRADLFNELVHRYERELYRYLARYLGDPTAAEDVFQNTFLQVHLKRGLFENGRPFRPWLYAIATHQAVDALQEGRPASDSESRSEGKYQPQRGRRGQSGRSPGERRRRASC